jgi:CBS domain-containing protein
VSTIKFTPRQKEIIKIVEKHQPVTGEEISQILKINKSTLRLDFSVLTKFNILMAKPKIGYSLAGSHFNYFSKEEIKEQDISEVMEVPTLISQDTNIKDAIINLFMYNTDILYAVDNNSLVGVVTKKDLLKISINGKDLEKIPVSLVMTRMPNVIYLYSKSSIYDGIQKLNYHQIDNIPIVKNEEQNGQNILKVIGQFSKTTACNLFFELLDK